MNYSQRQIELNAQFQLGIDTHLSESNIDIRFCSFTSNTQSCTNDPVLISSEDKKIQENISFSYPVFMRKGSAPANKAILLLHGLNERNWNK